MRDGIKQGELLRLDRADLIAGGWAILRPMEFHPKALLVTAVFLGLLWFTLERGFGFLTLATSVAIALEAVLGWGFWRSIPEERFSWFRRHA